MSFLFKCSMYYLSFLPLWLSVIFIDIKSIFIDKNNALYTEYISLVCIIVCLISSIICTVVAIWEKSNESGHYRKVIAVKEEKTITAEFLLSYILPLFTFDFRTWDGVLLFLVFFIVFGWLCIRHNYFCVNIVLESSRYRFYKCEMENEDGVPSTRVVISRQNLNKYIDQSIKMADINNEYMLVTKQSDMIGES